MCSQGKCLFCIKVETGALIFGVFSAIVTGLFTLVDIGFIIAFNYAAYNANDSDDFYEPGPRIEIFGERFHARNEGFSVLGNGLLAMATLKSLIDFTFAVLLCNGICKNKPSQVKAYFIYGIVMAVLSGIAVLILSCVSSTVIAFIGLLSLIIYCLLLHMVNMALEKITTGEVYQFQHKRLAETVY